MIVLGYNDPYAICFFIQMSVVYLSLYSNKLLLLLMSTIHKYKITYEHNFTEVSPHKKFELMLINTISQSLVRHLTRLSVWPFFTEVYS